ncbi:MAG: ferritin [Anaerolineae bacterium]|nr:ferritin [Anaerolineae bacterium]
MRVSDRLVNAINAEVGLELFAHHQYLAMAAYFESRSLDNLAAFFYAQAEEEKMHGLKLFKYLLERGALAVIPAIPAPQASFQSTEELMKLFVSQEEHVTEKFYEMANFAAEDKDHITSHFLQWFINEQMEEMATSNKLLDLVRMAGEHNLLMIEMMVPRLGTAEAEAGGEAAAE